MAIVSALSYFILLSLATTLPAGSKKFQFTHKPPAKVYAGTDLIILARSENNEDLDKVILFYRMGGEKEFKKLEMELFEGENYRGAILGRTLKKGAKFEYYIVGVDADGKMYRLFASKEKPHVIEITERPKAKAGGKKKAEAKTETPETHELDEEIVYTAAKKEQRVQNAPAVITVLTEEDIRAGGWRNLLEILRFVVGLDINDNGHWPDVGMRGVNPRVSYGDKLIILLDGHNMSWRQFNRNFINSSMISVDNIKRIEIIRGPGSAIWGSGAISGVINIITKTAVDLEGTEVTMGFSPLSGTYYLTLQGGGTVLNEVNVRASFSLHGINRGPRLAPIKEFLALSDDDYKKLNSTKDKPKESYRRIEFVSKDDHSLSQNFYIWVNWKGLSLRLHQSRYDPQAPLSTFSILGGDDSRFVTDRYIVTASYTQPVSDWGVFLAWSSFDWYNFAHGAAYEKNPLSDSPTLVKMAARDARFELGTQLSAEIAEFFSLFGGLELEYLDLIRWYFPETTIWKELGPPRFTNFHFSALLQASFRVKSLLEFTAGGRFDYDQVYREVFTPRVAAVLTPGLGLFFKLLYGNAFKAPSFHDLYYFRKDAFYGNPNLKPESVHTFEFQMGGRWSKLSISANGFLSLFSNLIGYSLRKAGTKLEAADKFPSSQQPDPDKDFRQKANKGSFFTYGAEFETRLYLIKNLTISGGLGLYFGQNGTLSQPKEGDPLLFASRISGNLFSYYRIPFKWGKLLFSLGAIFVGPKKVPPYRGKFKGYYFPRATFQEPKIPVPYWEGDKDKAAKEGLPFDPTLEAPFYVKSIFSVQLLDLLKHFDIALYINNLFNMDIYDAGRDLLFPQNRLELYLTLRIKY